MLNDLPPEIIYLIAGYLSRPCDLYHLLSSSRGLYNVLQPVLYTNVTLCGLQGIESSVSTFLYAITRTPKLASHVRTLEVGSWDTDYGHGEKACEKLGSDRNLIHKLVNDTTGYSDKERSKWINALKRGVTDAWLALLLPRLKALRKLSLTWPYGADYVLSMLQRASREEIPVFPHLEEVYATWYDTENAAHSNFMHPFFSFPSMRKLGGWKFDEPEDSDYEPDPDEIFEYPEPCLEAPPPRCSNITDIDLHETNAARGMRIWVQACKELKSFRIVHGGALISHNDIQPRKIYESLSLHKATLESIWIGNTEDTEWDNYDEWMGSFADFTALKFLYARAANLVGLDMDDNPARRLKDVLPPSLETLYLRLRKEDGFEQLIEFIGSEDVPKLSALYLEIDRGNDPEQPERLEFLKQLCLEKGILFHVPDTTDFEAWHYWGDVWPLGEASYLECC
ncbi:uncharacterized protein N7498_000249 [Penicillium cinerascens]|uniref:Leucine-rich repeat domain-containing protein n=1 Tax=Penicillium cinerascens TaxID=70096 RepID=A0A9W9TE19_9EURO|nr:uncharacterized protein N7498_000249 [Penicillium cinerascens]KAJ5218150.1 hypothetical protein N7498_000249 [Penicillium cinerascens]